MDYLLGLMEQLEATKGTIPKLTPVSLEFSPCREKENRGAVVPAKPNEK